MVSAEAEIFRNRVIELRQKVREWSEAVKSARGYFERRERTKELKKWAALLERAERTYFNLRQGKLTLVEKSPAAAGQKRDTHS